MANYKLPKLFNPAYSPTVKPTVPVEIDWSHPITSGLKNVFGFGDTFGGFDYDLATGNKVSISSSVGTIEQSANKLVTGNGTVAKLDISEDWSGASTVVFIAKINSVDSSYGGLFSKNTTSTNSQLGIGRYSTQDYLYLANSNSGLEPLNTKTLSSLLSERHIFTATLASSNSSAPLAFYVDGVLVYSDNMPATAQTSGSGALYLGGERASNPSYDSDVEWECFYRFDRVLTDAEIKLLHEQPYSILKPANELVYSIQGAGANYKLPKLFNPAYSPTQKPTVPVEVDWSHPLAQHLRFAERQEESKAINIVNGDILTSTHNDTHVMDAGDHYCYVSNATVWLASTTTDYYDLSDTNELTINTAFSFDDLLSATDNILIRLDDNAGNYQFSLSVFPSTDTVRYLVRTTGTSGWTASAQTASVGLVAGRVHTFTMTYKNGSGISLYVDGVYKGGYSATGNIAPISPSVLTLMGGKHPSTLSPKGRMKYAYIFDKALDDVQVRYLYEQPYSILKPVIEPVYYTTGSGTTNTNITATTDSITLTEQSATVEAGTTISATTDSITLTEQSANINNALALTATTDNITLTEQVAVVDNAYHISAGTDSISVTTQTALVTVESASGVIGDGVIGDGVVGAKAAEDIGTIVNTTADNIALTESNASVNNARNVIATTDTIALAEQAASIEASKSITATTDNIVITTYQASVAGAVTLETLQQQITDLTALVEKLIEFNGLDPANPHTISQTSRISTNINVTITDNGDGTVTLSS